MRARTVVLSAVLAVTSVQHRASAQRFEVPHRSYSPDQVGQIIGGQLGTGKHNQPAMVDGALLLAGNASFTFYDISNPLGPLVVSEFVSPYSEGEAESHSISFARDAEGRVIAATISGRGVDLWDLSDVENPVHLSAVLLDGVNYGDRTEAVWGIHHQGRYVYVGGTNTGLHIIDATDSRAPVVVAHVPTSEFGGVSAGPLFAVGNLLVITTPKSSAGIATLDISDPIRPRFYDSLVLERASYFGGFFGATAYLINPLRAYDVTGDPTNITLVGTHNNVEAEYLNFGNGRLYLGGKRPNSGLDIFALPEPGVFELMNEVPGRQLSEIDDQFTLPIGNLVVLSDDQLGVGSVLAVEQAALDDVPPEVAYVNPADQATGQALTTRVGVSMSDQVDLGSVSAESFVVRRVGDEVPLEGTYGATSTLLSFSPAAPLEADATYEVILAEGGVSDFVGNTLPRAFRSVFSTGTQLDVLDCGIADAVPQEHNTDVRFESNSAADLFEWDFGDGSRGEGRSTSHRFEQPGRYIVTLRVRRGERTTACSAVHIAHGHLSDLAPTRSSTIAVDSERRRVVSVNTDANSVSVFDADSHARLMEVAVCDAPRNVAISLAGVAWITCRDAARIVGIDIMRGSLRASVAMPYGSQPEGIALSPNGDRFYVSLAARGEVLAFSTETQALLAQTRVGRVAPPWERVGALAVDPQSERVLVARTISGRDEGSVYSLSAELDDVQRVSLAEDPGPDTAHAGRGIPNYLNAIAVSPDASASVVAGSKANTSRGFRRDGLALNFDNTVRTLVTRIALRQDGDAPYAEEAAEMRVDIDDSSLPSAIAYSARGDLLFVATMASNRVDVFDAYTHLPVAGFSTGAAPSGLAVDGNEHLFVHESLSRSVRVIDISALSVGRGSAAAHLATMAALDVEPLAPEVLLGKQLFHNASDPRISNDGYIACASCHLDGGEDGRVWDFTSRGEGLRNTISLEGRAGTRHGPLHWSANFDEIHDFEGDIRLAFGGSGLMDDADYEPRADALGQPKAGVSDALDALAAYVSSLESFPRSPHREADGSMSESALRGAMVFESARCADCHSGEEMTDSAVGVLHDVGTLREESGSRRGEALMGLDTPTLVGVWATAPYLHDGSAETLHDVLLRPGHGTATELDSDERADLVAYLLQLELRPPENRSGGGLAGGCGCRVSASDRSPNALGLWALLLITMVRRARRNQRSSATPQV